PPSFPTRRSSDLNLNFSHRVGLGGGLGNHRQDSALAILPAHQHDFAGLVARDHHLSLLSGLLVRLMPAPTAGRAGVGFVRDEVVLGVAVVAEHGCGLLLHVGGMIGVISAKLGTAALALFLVLAGAEHATAWLVLGKRLGPRHMYDKSWTT